MLRLRIWISSSVREPALATLFARARFVLPVGHHFLTGRYPRTTRCRQNGQAIPPDELLVSTLFHRADGTVGLLESCILLPARMEKSRFEPKMDMMISHGHIILSLTGKKMPTLNG